MDILHRLEERAAIELTPMAITKIQLPLWYSGLGLTLVSIHYSSAFSNAIHVTIAPKAFQYLKEAIADSAGEIPFQSLISSPPSLSGKIEEKSFKVLQIKRPYKSYRTT